MLSTPALYTKAHTKEMVFLEREITSCQAIGKGNHNAGCASYNMILSLIDVIFFHMSQSCNSATNKGLVVVIHTEHWVYLN